MRRAERVGIGQALDEIGDVFQAVIGREGRQVDEVEHGAVRRCAAGDRGAELGNHLFGGDLRHRDLVLVLGVVLLGERLENGTR
ncbi:hypothetical protein D3C87_1755940 [compost metagenome]